VLARSHRFIVPNSQINLTQSLLVAYDDFFRSTASRGWLGARHRALCGVIGGVTVWVADLRRSRVVGRAGYLPPFFQKMNKNGVASHILLVQG